MGKPATTAPGAAAAEPLIQDVTPGAGKKTALKKGFFNNKTAAPLYGPEGSKEGVLPENAGDPLGYLPKKLRNSSKIIDCNSPEFQKQQEQKKKIEDQNKMQQEFRDTMMEGFNSFTARQAREIWSSDSPEGTEEVPAKKYNNDYSRFDQIEEEPEKAPEDNRDYYFDQNGNPVKKKQPATQNKPAQSEEEQLKFFMEQAEKLGVTSDQDKEEAKALSQLLNDASQVPPPNASATDASRSEAPAYPAVKKGFLDGKKSLYGNKGSPELEPMSDVDMMKQFGDLLGASFGESSGSRPAARDMDDVDRAPSLNVKTSSLQVPSFKLNETASDALQLVVEVPGLLSMHGVDLDVTDRRAMLDFPAGAGLRPLQVELPCSVVPTSVKAKFSKSKSTITVTLPRKNVN